MSTAAVIKNTFSSLLTLVVLGGAGWGAYQIFQTPTKPKRQAAEAPVPVVGVAALSKQTIPVKVEAFGTVIPARVLEIRSQVRGRIQTLHPDLEIGGVLTKGQTLVEIEPDDFEIAIRRAEAALAQANTTLSIEQGRQMVAKREWELLKGDADPSNANRDLALRVPQLKRVEAMLDAARADLADAKLQLARTKLIVPFDAIVADESVEVTQLIDTQTRIARLVGTEAFWVEAAVPLARLPHIQMAGSDQPGSAVSILLGAGANPIQRRGHVLRELAELDPDGRMARVLIEIPDPMALKPDTKVGRLPLGSYVRLQIESAALEGVYAIPRTALRENDRVWVRDLEGRLQIRPIEILWRRQDDVLVANGFGPGEQLITSHLSRVLPGMPVRTRDSEGAATKPLATSE